jgi:hypothetical protein
MSQLVYEASIALTKPVLGLCLKKKSIEGPLRGNPNGKT